MSTYQKLVANDHAPPMAARTAPNGAPSLRYPSQRHLIPATCWNCNARLLIGGTDIPTATDLMHDVICHLCSRVAVELVSDAVRPKMTPEQFRALPTIAAGAKTGPSSQYQADVLCPDCKTAWIRPTSARCRSCAAEHRERAALKYRLLAALETGQPFQIDGLMARFGTTEYGIRHAIRNLQKDGKPVQYRNGVVSLKGVQG